MPLHLEADRRIPVEWNATERAWRGPDCVHLLIEEQARRTPDAPAVAGDGAGWTYRDLDQRANALARRILSLGVGSGARVAVCLERTPALVAATLAVMKAGAAYLPLDPGYPADRLAFMVEDAGVAAVITDSAVRGRLPARAAPAELLMDDASAEEGDGRSPDVRASGDDIAYVIYTSGSTGAPKGVQVPHRALANFIRSMRERPGLASSDVVLAVTTLSFDIAALELYLPLVVGARVELASRAVARDGRLLRRAMETSGATLMQATPATWRMLVAAGWPGDQRLTALCGGEALSPELARELRARTRALWNMYGPTETTVWSTVHEVDGVEGPIPIGRPIANTTLYILDGQLRPVPVGAPGELYIGGAGVARGYLGRPELTAERFIEDPFAPGAGARMYRTGDLARYRPDGTVDCLGRVDRQLKIRGFRVEPGEIESALLKQEGVRQAAVMAREDERGRRLVAYVVRDAARPPSPAALREALRARLPAHMVPARIVPLEALPLTPNGKLDLGALPAPEDVEEEEAVEVLAPRDDVERKLARLWAGVLGREPCGIREDFFDAGGDSLMAVGLFVDIERAFGRDLPLATLVEAPTIEALAHVLRAAPGPAAWSPLVALQPSGTRPPFFCVHGVGGNVLNYRALASCLGPDQPFYGLQARGLDGAQAPLTRIEDMADFYVGAVRKVQPRGPYLLGGASFGGNVAVEMARRLAAAGDEVQIVALFDTYPTGFERHAPAEHARRPAGLVARLGVHARAAVHRGDGAVYLRKKARRVFRRALYRAWQAAFAAFRSLGRPLPRALRRVQQANYQALRDYAPPRYPGPVALFSATEEPPEFRREKQVGWAVLAEAVDVHEVPGDHITMVTEPHVRALAERLRACLDRGAPPGFEFEQGGAPSHPLEPPLAPRG